MVVISKVGGTLASAGRRAARRERDGKRRKTRGMKKRIYTAGIDRTVSLSNLETEGRRLGGMVAHLVMDSEDRRVG